MNKLHLIMPMGGRGYRFFKDGYSMPKPLIELEGKPFTVHVANGDKVKKGQLLVEADLEAIKAAGLNTITPILVCNSSDFSTFNKTTGKDVTNADVVIEMGK